MLGGAERARQVLAVVDLPADLRAQAEGVLDKAVVTHVQFPTWPVPELPRRVALACGAPAGLAADLAAVGVLFYAAADITDDAQDDDLPDDPRWRAWGWRHAVNTGNFLLFAALEHLVTRRAPVAVRAAWAAAYATTGRRLAGGQCLDLLAGADHDVDEDTLLATSREKAGAAWGFFASLGPLYARLDPAPYIAFGEALGTLAQAASDLRPYLTPHPHPDLATGKLTLALHYARTADPSVTAPYAKGPLDPFAQNRVRRHVAALGGVMYAQMRVRILETEARSLLASGPLAAAQDALVPLVDAVALDDDLDPLALSI